MSIVGARLDSPDAAVPTGVALGSHGVGPISWYLRFGARWNTIGRIDRALLTLSPLPGAPVGQHDVPVDAWRVTEQWSADELAWLDQPDAALPHARGIARGAPAQDLRLDVTELAAFWQAHGHENHGLVLRTGSRKGLGVTFATGAAAARGPELELYVAREQ